MNMNQMNILVTGYYYKQNTGDDLLLQYAQSIFTSKHTSHPATTTIHTRIISTDALPFDKPDVITELVKWTDRVVLFGGEVINTYFLDRLIRLKYIALNTHRKNILFYAFGVSCNADVQEITSHIDLFEYVVFRNRKDYHAFLPRLTDERCAVLPDPVFGICRKTLTGSSCIHRGIDCIRDIRDKVSSTCLRRRSFHIGLFLSQTCKQDEFIEAIVRLIVKCVRQYRAKVSLFTMCNSESPTENDRVINKNVVDNLKDHLTPKDLRKVTVYDSPSDIFRHIESLDVAICWRFHAHVFCIQHAIPFISLSTTPKVKTLLTDNHLAHLSYADNLAELDNDGLEFILRESPTLQQQLNTIWKQLHAQAKRYKKDWYSILSMPSRDLIRTPVTDVVSVKPVILTHIQELYRRYSREGDHEYNATVLLFLITGKLKTPYHWGLVEKMRDGATIDSLRDDIDWVIGEQVRIGEYAFYWRVLSYLGIECEVAPRVIPQKRLHIHYIDQNDMKGVHRAGWEYVIHHIESEMGTMHPLATRCDLYVDRTFHWNHDLNVALGVIPYRVPWVGFIHHTSNTEYTRFNVVELFKKPSFRQSLATCKGLIVLTNYLKKQVKAELQQANYSRIPVFVLYHPTEFIEDARCFDMDAFEKQEARRIVQVGAWYRDIGAIFQLNMGDNQLNYTRCALNGPQMSGYYRFLNEANTPSTTITSTVGTVGIGTTQSQMQISRDDSLPAPILIPTTPPKNTQKPVELLSELTPQDYDRLFQLCIIFIRLIDGSAANTIIEAIVRNTPILVNRIEPVVEYLGKEYPFYYTTLEEAGQKANDMELIRKTHKYLKRMDKSFLDVKQFIRSFQSLPVFSG